MEIAIGIMGGLGLFLFGMNLMGEALEKAAGSKLKKIIELLTSNSSCWYNSYSNNPKFKCYYSNGGRFC